MPAVLRIFSIFIFFSAFLYVLLVQIPKDVQAASCFMNPSVRLESGGTAPISDVPQNTRYFVTLSCSDSAKPANVSVTAGVDGQGITRSLTNPFNGEEFGPFNGQTAGEGHTVAVNFDGNLASCSGCTMSFSGSSTPIPTTLPTTKSCNISPTQIDVGQELTVSPINFPANATNQVSMIGAFGSPTISLGSLPNGGNLTVNLPTAANGLYRVRILDGANFVYCNQNLAVGEAAGIGANPCTTGATGECETAIGNIPITVRGLADRLLQIGIGVAGGFALILIVIGGIRVLMSQGDQQAVNGGREMVVAAVAGLLFLIFSTLILQFIGVNVLKGIPGIGN